MKSEIAGLRIAAAIFALVFLAHLVRLMTHFNIIIAGYMMPLWASVLGLLIAGGLAFWMWHLSRRVTGSI